MSRKTTNTGLGTNVGVMLGQRRRPIPTLCQRLVFTGNASRNTNDLITINSDQFLAVRHFIINLALMISGFFKSLLSTTIKVVHKSYIRIE